MILSARGAISLRAVALMPSAAAGTAPAILPTVIVWTEMLALVECGKRLATDAKAGLLRNIDLAFASAPVALALAPIALPFPFVALATVPFTPGAPWLPFPRALPKRR